eukprot:5395291-Amphidinium_carterae.1
MEIVQIAWRVKSFPTAGSNTPFGTNRRLVQSLVGHVLLSTVWSWRLSHRNVFSIAVLLVLRDSTTCGLHTFGGFGVGCRHVIFNGYGGGGSFVAE